jgi:uncharacterized protein YcfL
MKKVIFSTIALFIFAGCTETPKNPCDIVDSELATLDAKKKSKEISGQEHYFGKRELQEKYPDCKISF